MFLWKDIFQHGAIANGSEPFDVLGIGIPMLWGLIAANTILQYVHDPLNKRDKIQKVRMLRTGFVFLLADMPASTLCLSSWQSPPH